MRYDSPGVEERKRVNIARTMLEDGGNSQAGKAIFRQITAAARAHMERIKQAKDTKQMISKGATNDSR